MDVEKSIALSLHTLYLPNAVDFTFYYDWLPVVLAVSSKKTIIPTTDIDNWPHPRSLRVTPVSFLGAIYPVRIM